MEPSSILILVIGIVVVAALLLFAICYCRMNQRKLQRYMSPAKKEVTNEDDDRDLNGAVELAITKAFTDEEFCWSRQGSSEGFTIEDINNIVLITHQFTGTHAARSNLGFLRGRHVWEITWPRDCRDNHSCIGVGTYQAPLYNRGLLDLVGFNIQSWGWNIKNINLIHNNRTIKKYPDVHGQENIPDQLIVSLDMEKGTLSFGSYQSSYGVAFKGLGGGRLPLFPMISTTALDVRVAIKYIGSACLPYQATEPSNHNEITSGNITAYTTHKAVNRTPNAKFEPSITPGSIMKSIRRSFKRKKKYPQSQANTPVSTIGGVSSYQMRRDPRRNLYHRDTSTTLNLNSPRYNQYSPKQYPVTVTAAAIHPQNQRGVEQTHGTSQSKRGHENAAFHNEYNHNRDEHTPQSADRTQEKSPRYDPSRYTESRDTFAKQSNNHNAGGPTHHMIHDRDSTFEEQRNPLPPARRAKQSADYRDHHTIQQQRHESGPRGHYHNTGTGDPIRPSRRNDTQTRYSNDTSRSESADSYSYKTNSNYSSRQYGNHGQREVNSSSPSYTQSDYSKSKGAFRPVVNSNNQYKPALDNSYRSQPLSSFNV